MINSMTGFGNASVTGPWGELRCEIRAVNHRYLETQIHLPEVLRPLEQELREKLRARVGRGKVECKLGLFGSGDEAQLALDLQRAEQVIRCAQELAKMADSSAQINPMEVLAWPGVQQESKPGLDQFQETASSLFESVLDRFLDTREREGQALAGLVSQRITGMRESCAGARRVVPEILRAQQERIRTRIAEAGAELEEKYLEGELVLLAQKMDVAEELDRLEAHLDEVAQILDTSKAPCGRRLDFLMQELNREANTLGSKSQGIDSTRHAVDMKVLIEQMREQIQNIE